MYNGTITISDPLLVEEITEGLPEGIRAFVTYDQDAENPRTWYDHSTALVRTNTDTIEPDGNGDWRHSVTRDALEHFGHDFDLIARYLKMFHDAAAVVVEDCGAYRTYNPVIGWITEADARELARSPEDVVKSDLEEYRQWAAGEVYGVIVTDEKADPSENEAAIGGIYDDFDFSHIRSEIIPDLIAELRD